MVTRMRLVAATVALLTAVVVVAQGEGAQRPQAVRVPDLQLRSTGVPLIDAPPPSLVIPTTDPSPFDACRDIPIDVTDGLGLGFTPPEPEDSGRCHYDAGNYQLAVEPIIWRTYEQSLPADAVELTINGHRAAQFWVMKPTDWNDRWWVSCMIAYKTSWGLIQQSLFYSPKYSNPAPDCLQENVARGQQLSPFYKF
ncbi:DUF3558 domain-containing protein [Mycolicibacterium komossense]|uniref:DUF3558 domain-containing protein n=1 Tax=Mycolicibacterium komossense TaxID=1779 RepID=A0ABT3CAM6_9MYCO|nr:DUF3558 domain-containing protein [Mycolicibacterium komossense]MCV7226512.1 DUF3558 domain-containing protein [Mycolicibacterium komossense]